MRIVFFGTPEYVVPILKQLVRLYGTGEGGIVSVVTQSPKPTGRKKYIERSAVDNWAFKKKIPVTYDLSEVPDADLGVLASYGKIIPKATLNKFKYGILNIHPSLLPEFRGASPVQAAIATGQKQTGLTIIKMDEKMDSGPIVSSFKEEIKETDTTETLRNRLFTQSTDFLIGLLPSYLNNTINPKEQDLKKASFTTLVKKQDAFIKPEFVKAALEGKALEKKWEIPFVKSFKGKVNAASLSDFIHSMNPWPIAWTSVKISPTGQKAIVKRLKIIKSHQKQGKLFLEVVQLEGKNPVTWREFEAGYPKVQFADS